MVLGLVRKNCFVLSVLYHEQIESFSEFSASTLFDDVGHASELQEVLICACAGHDKSGVCSGAV